jgi:methylation protein EvaC
MMNCKVCGGSTHRILDLGQQPMANALLTVDQLNESEYFYHLTINFCEDCLTVQLGECPDPSKVFNENYAYFTGTSNYMKRHFRKLADEIKRDYLTSLGTIVEIGSNDGTFLENFLKWAHLGIEPSGSVWTEAGHKQVCCWNRFFDEETADDISYEYGKADVIVSTNAFPHILNRTSVLNGIKRLLKPNGIWINEEACIQSIFSINAYDQFYNEHIYTSSYGSMQNTLEMFGMTLFEQTRNISVHGGSTRFYAGNVDNTLYRPLSKEVISSRSMGLLDFELWQEMVDLSKRYFSRKLEIAFSRDKEIVGYGATAKSTTILNYCNISSDKIKRIYDTTPIKIGKYSPGKHIPIVDYSTFKKDKPKNVVLFAWNHSREIFEKELDMNINWITPI